MKLISLEINRPYSYSHGCAPLQGSVKLGDYVGNSRDTKNEMSVELSPATIAKIINLIAADVQRQALFNANRLTGALREAAANPATLANDGNTIDESTLRLR